MKSLLLITFLIALTNQYSPLATMKALKDGAMVRDIPYDFGFCDGSTGENLQFTGLTLNDTPHRGMNLKFSIDMISVQDIDLSQVEVVTFKQGSSSALSHDDFNFKSHHAAGDQFTWSATHYIPGII